MWRSLWRSIDRFSLNHFKHVITELREIKVVDEHNKELVIDLLQSIVEIVTYGDKQDPAIFECFMEYQVLAEFVRVLKISKNSRIEAPLLQYLSIMIQNLDSEHAIYYCFSNGYINNIIVHRFDFNRGDLAQYYVSFLRAVSSKINRDTLCLLVKVQGDSVVSFPLFDEALKFARHEEKMIQTAIRSLSLSIYNVSDDLVYQYITTAPVSRYFSDLVLSLKEQCTHLDVLVHDSEVSSIHTKRKQLFLQAEKIVDELYYFKDILDTGESRLSRLVIENLLSLLVFPVLHPLLKLRERNVPNLSATTSLYLVSRLLQVVGGKDVVNPIAVGILHPYFPPRFRDDINGSAAEDDSLSSSFLEHLNTMEEMLDTGPEFEEEKIVCSQDNVCIKRTGLSAFICSEDHSLLLQSLFLLFSIAESKDLHCLLHPVIGLNGMHEEDKSFFSKYIGQILNALLKILASQAPFSVLIKWNTGWFLRKLITAPGKRLDDHSLQRFNTSYEQSREHLERELDGCWFDHIPDTLRNEWNSCKKVLEESCQRKDPLFALEISAAQQISNDDKTAQDDWQRMVDAVKVFVLHFQLKSYMIKGSLIEHPLPTMDSPACSSGQTHASDISTASFGSEVSLATAVPCKIAFSNSGIRDIYIIPVATGISGKLLLTEKHPFRGQRGVVLAIAPLAGLSPKIDEVHPWLHLRIREFDPKFTPKKTKGNRPNIADRAADGKWTLGFESEKSCDAARSLILEETRKQRSNVRSLLSPLLHDELFEDSLNGYDE